MASVTTTTAANLLQQVWRPSLPVAAAEERVVTRNWDNGNQGVQKIGKTLNIRKVGAIGATKPSAGSFTSITYTANTESVVQVTPTFAYAAVQIEKSVLTQILDDQRLQAAYKQAIAEGIAAQMDADGGVLAASLSTSIVGSGGVNISKSLVLDGLQALMVAGKNRVQNATMKYFVYHTSQHKYVLDIAEITAANIRGDGEKPMRAGFVATALGLEFSNSGNIYQSGGVSHNLLHIRDSHVLGFNAQPDFQDPQMFDLAVKIIGFTEYGVGEVWDEYAVDVQTAA